MKTVTIFDLETNGRIGNGDHVIQFGYMILRGRKVISEGAILFNRDLEWNPHAYKVHNIPKSVAMNYGIRPEIFYAHDCKKIMSSDIIVGHNILGFDLTVLKHDFDRCGIEFPELNTIFDTLTWSRNTWGWGGNKLGEVYQRFFGKPFANAHNAYADVKATANIFDKIVRSDPRVVDMLFDGDLSLYSEEFKKDMSSD